MHDRTPLPSRRSALASFAVAIFHAACRRAGRADSGPTSSSPIDVSPGAGAVAPHGHEGLRVYDVEVSGGAWDKRAVFAVPDPLPEAELPLLVALHGLGETVDPNTGAHAWLDAYDLDVAVAKLRDPPLSDDAFHGLVTPEHLQEVNARLSKQAYRGLVVCCPFLPRAIGGDVSYVDYANYLGNELLPRVRAQAPVRKDVRATGIDGVSLGGVTALNLGLLRPDLFGAIGTLQAAIANDQADHVADDIAKRIGQRPLRITTSQQDVFRDVLVALDQKLNARGVPHDFAVAEGPHDYIWNKGPGAVEMLLWNDRILRR